MKKFSIILIISMLIIFTSCILYTKNSVKVIKVYSPSQIALDLNKNGKVEANEKFTVDGITTFTSKTSAAQKNLAESMGIDEETALAIGYFAEKYAQSLLEDKNVKYKKLDNKNVIIKFNGKNYNKIIKNSPFAIKNKQPANQKGFEKQIKLAKTYQLRIYNNKSNKYHRLNCQYGQLAHDFVIVPKNQLPKDAQACKVCENAVQKIVKTPKNNQFSKEQEIIKTTKPEKFELSQEKIKIFLTDLTTMFTPNSKCTTNYCLALVEQINNTNKTIDMALYGYTDIPDITIALQNAIKRGVLIRLVYDVNVNGSNFYPDTFNLASVLNESKADYGEPNYQSSIMHNKFFIFDRKVVLTGSANISTTDISGVNSNAIILIKSSEIAEIYEKEFNQMYENKFHYKKSKIENTENILLGDSIVSVYFSPQDSVIDTSLIPYINNAKSYIYIPTFVITHKNVTQALIDAKERNVDVKVILDATNANNKHTTHERLRRHGIEVKTENFAGKMHSKSVIIDDKYTFIGSMNLSKSGTSRNDENVVLIENPNIAKFYKNFFLYVWEKIPEIWLTKNVASESHDSIGSCYDGIDNDFDEKIDFEDSGCLQKK